MDGDTLLIEFLERGGVLLEDIVDELGPAVEISFANIREGLFAPAFLPTRRRRDGSRIWYGLVAAPFAVEELVQLTRASIEPGLGTVTAPTDVIDPGSLATLLDEETNGRWVFVDVPEEAVEAAEALGRLATNLRWRAARGARNQVRSVSRVLEDLDRAVSIGDQPLLDQLLEELAQLPRLTADNRCFVLVHARTRAGRHAAALKTEGLDRLIDAVPPERIRADVLTSLHSLMIAPARVDLDPTLLSDAQREILGAVASIPPRRLDGAQAEVLLVASELGMFEAPVAEDVQSLALAARAARERALVDDELPAPSPRLLDDKPIDDRATPQEQLRTALAAFDEKRIQQIVAAHPEVLDDPVAARFVRPFMTLPVEAIDAHGSVDNQAVAQFEDGRDASPPTSWSGWIDRAMADAPWPESRAAAEEGVRVGWLAAPEDLDHLADAVDDAREWQAERLRGGLALLLDSADELGDVHGRRGLVAAIRLIADFPPETEAELHAVAAWCDTLGRVGMSEAQTADVLLYVDVLLERSLSSWNFGWAVDLVLALCRAAAVRRSDHVVNLFAMLQTHALQRPARLPTEVRESLLDLSLEVNQKLVDVLRPPEGQDDVLASLESRTVAIHTLTISAAQAARNVIDANAPDATVVLNHDKKSTQRLRALAESADIFLFTSRSCQHAASDAIDAVRPSRSPVLYVDGTGKSSILRRLREHLEQEGMDA